MLETLRPGESILWDCFWQATVFLGVGLGASVLLARRPARAHRLLVLAMLAALAAPLLAQAARLCGWGLLTHRVENPLVLMSSSKTGSIVAVDSPADTRVSLTSPALAHATQAEGIGATPIDAQRPAIAANAAGRSSPYFGYCLRLPTFGWRTLAFGGWLILTALAVVRLVTSLFLGLHMVRRARPLNDKTLADSAVAAGARLGMIVAPELRVSPQVRCPSIWCWCRRPVIVLPEDVAAETSINWVGVFCHELAHWLRGDHWWSVLGEVLVCALPWHPLAWWARHRSTQLSELACDDWVLATGLPATEYADLLLRLIPQRRGSMALAAVSSRRGLFGRLRQILDERQRSPVVGVRWTCLSLAAMVLAASAMALAQTRPLDKSQQSKLDDGERRLSTSTPSPARPMETTKRRSISGTVVGTDGKSIAGATVFWLSYPKAVLHPLAIPKDQKAKPPTGADVLGETRTDANGRFSLTADFDPDRYNHRDGSNVVLLVKAPAMGMLAHVVEAGATDVALRLAPEVLIRGRLLTPSGAPAAGVRVTLHDFFNDEMTEGMAVGTTSTDDLVPRYWPKPRSTDADGRFTFDGLPQGTYANLDFWHPDYSVDEVTVDTAAAAENSGVMKTYLKAFEIPPVKPTFTHALEPARPVEGRVTDKQTGQPLAGFLIQMTPMRRHGGTTFHARTDAQGRYRVSVHSAETYRTAVYPPGDSVYLAARDRSRNWPAGAKFLEKDFALVKGRIIRGRVIDADTNRPIAVAAVGYQPRGNNPNNREEYDFSNTVLTDSEGRFRINTLPGQGIVAVQTPDETYARVPGGPLVSGQGVSSIDVPNYGEAKPVEIAVRKGAVVKAKVVGPDGKPLADVAASCEGIAPMVMIHAWEPSEKAIFRLAGADPVKTYRVFFLQPDRQLGAVVDLKPDSDSKQPVEVVLQPMAKVHGTVVNENGSRAEGVQVQPMIAMGKPKEGEATRSEIFRDTTFYAELMGQKSMLSYFAKILEPKPKGEFVIDTLVPGVRFYITAGAGRREAVVSVPPLKPGEDRDQGTIILKERKP
jgi:5-hydroxyisourate hydrolase-like protein (transthyretin family)/protocatechuate 3,4-dioxygenase beta subunit